MLLSNFWYFIVDRFSKNRILNNILSSVFLVGGIYLLSSIFWDTSDSQFFLNIVLKIVYSLIAFLLGYATFFDKYNLFNLIFSIFILIIIIPLFTSHEILLIKKQDPNYLHIFIVIVAIFQAIYSIYSMVKMRSPPRINKERVGGED